MGYIFISYSRKDQDYAHRLATMLINSGFDVWLDAKIDYGDNWERTIFEAIDKCEVFIVLMSPDAYASDWVQRECHHAEKRQKKPFPILLAGEEFPRYGLTQYVNALDGDLPGSDFIERLARQLPRQEDIGKIILSEESKTGAIVENVPANVNPKKLFTLSSSRQLSPALQDALNKLLTPQTLPIERARIGQELDMVSDPRRGTGLRQDGIPDIDWCKIPAGEFIYQAGDKRTLPDFYISRYPITNEQFSCFLNDAQGYKQDHWWKGLGVRQRQPGKATFPIPNHPCENISWYDAMAFCQWLSARLNYPIRLPTDLEWEKAARGIDGRAFPWGDEYKPGSANVNETAQLHDSGSFLLQTTAVGMYLHAPSPYGILDMGGNVWEWCLNPFDEPDAEALDEMSPRTLRGGSWYNPPMAAQTTFRAAGDADGRTSLVGFRVVRAVT